MASKAATKLWIGGAVTVAILIGAGTAYFFKNPEAINIINPTNQVAEITVTGYLIESRDNKFVAVPIPVKAKNNEEAIATAFKTLISQQRSDLYSAIPPETQILGLVINGDDIRLNLSQPFTAGGGSASMHGRLIQTLYTATSLNPNANLFLSVEGKPLEYLGGEGLEVPQPLRRANLALEF